MSKINDIEQDIHSQAGLTKAFEVFNQTLGGFMEAYHKLEEKVEVVNHRLEAANSELEEKMTELAAMKEYTESILESMPSGVLVVDMNGLVNNVNCAFLALTGLTAEKVLGRLANQVVQINVCWVIDKLRNEGGTHYEEKRLVRSNGESVPVSCSVALLHDKKNRPVGGVIIYHDRTLEKELESRLRKKEQLALLGQMSASVAHEIRNPLGGIEGFASLLSRDLEDDIDKKKLADNIVTGVRDLNKTVTELLEFTKPYDMCRAYFDLSLLVDESLMLIKSGYEVDKIKITRDFPGSDWSVHADRDRFKQVLNNLILNAVQAAGNDNAEVVLRGKRQVEYKSGKYFCLEVIDSGCGIPPKIIETIFNPFFTTRARGTGLGLAIANKIVELHHGGIEVESEPGQKTVFRVYIPEGESI